MILKLEKKIINYYRARKIAQKLKTQGKRLVFVPGCYDLFHLGHAIFFEQAKSFGDVLFVGVGTDESVKKIKGGDRPIYPLGIRVRLVAAIENVDYVLPLKEKLKMPGKMNHELALRVIRPHYYVINRDDSALNFKKQLARQLNIQVKLVDRERPRGIPYISTTKTFKIIKSIK